MEAPSRADAAQSLSLSLPEAVKERLLATRDRRIRRARIKSLRGKPPPE
ncbi:hypothetical protein [Sediminicurvatus halobius]|nr:hypothetical protein [Spiribacter halobius]UEX79605.1 hypothetical protein LMH63_08150 [Spiribacter halobius]